MAESGRLRLNGHSGDCHNHPWGLLLRWGFRMYVEKGKQGGVDSKPTFGHLGFSRASGETGPPPSRMREAET